MTTMSQIPTEGEAGPEESAEWEKKDPGYQHLGPTSNQIYCWHYILKETQATNIKVWKHLTMQ